MKIWQLSNDEKGISLFTTYDKDTGCFVGFNGDSKLKNWEPVHLSTDKKGTKRDFTIILSGVLVFLGRTKAILDPIIRDYVEYLPAIHDEYEVSVVNVTNILDCVDKDRSIEHRITGNRLLEYTQIYFHKELMNESSLIFRIPEVPRRIYVNDTFRNLVVKEKLKGIELIEVWDSEFTEDMERDRQERYNAKLAAIENIKGPRLSYSDAIKLVESGRAVAHKQWKIQLDKEGVMLHGILKEDCSYQWIDPVYIPPIFLEIEWVEVEKSDK